MKYRADIDGLRTLAVSPVVLFHSGLALFSGGFVGVDIFFVISGYLITTIIHDDISNGRFSILRFYERRARRILPALIFVMLVTAAFVYVLYLPQYLVDFARSMLSVSLFLSNMYFWKFSGYFDSSAQLRPLLHSWSLSVEEQFYIFMPLAMLVFARLKNRWQVVAFLLVALASFALSIAATRLAPTANFFLLPTRSWELLCGALLAIGKPRLPPQPLVINGLAAIGLAGILLPVFLYTESTPFPGLAALPPCLGATLLLYTGASPVSFARQILSTGFMVFIGKISYSLYLVHWPIAVLLRYVTLREPTLVDAALIVCASAVLAVFSWRYVEQPFRTPGLVGARKAVFVSSALALTTTGVLAGVTMAGKGFPGRYPELMAEDRINHRPIAGSDGLDLTWRNGKCFFENDDRYKSWNASDCVINADEQEPLLLWGDSYAAHYIPGLMLNRDKLDYRIYLYTYAGCPPVLDYTSYARIGCEYFNKNALEIIDRLKIRHVVLSARWIDLRYRGLGLLANTIAALKAKGVSVTVIGQSPLFVTDTKVIDFRKSNPAEQQASWPAVVHEDLNRSLGKVAAGAVQFIDPLAFLCENGSCAYKRNGRLLYSDEGHFSPEGSSLAIDSYFAKGIR